jgi:two-component system, OmpR family, aerobic respiration control sensor histidine kinase ArcB
MEKNQNIKPNGLPNLAESTIQSTMLHMPDYVFQKNHDSFYVWCNENFAKLVGLDSNSKICGKTDHDLWNTELADRFIIDDQCVLRKGMSLCKEYKLSNKKGTGSIYLRIDRAPLYDESNNIIGVLAIGTDITEQKYREIGMLHQHAFLEDIFYNLPGLIYWKNTKFQYMGFNKNVVVLSGLSREQLLGKTDPELNWGQREAVSFQRDDQEVMETGIVKVTEYEIPIKRADGHYIVVKTEKSRLYDRKGKVAGILAIAIDITEQKILEAKLIAEKERVEQVNKVKTEFIRNMEHDIRTPFTGIYTLSKILEQKETDPQKKEQVGMIGQCAKELLDYCNGILDFSRTESGHMPLIAKKFNLQTLIMGVMALEKPAAINKGLQFITVYPPNIPTIFIGDQYRIQRILVNLIGNAIKFTQTGYIKLEVEFTKQINNRECIIRLFVEDTGIGIPNDKQSIIYERFSRLTPSNQAKYKGVGLGLSIVKHLIDEVEGEIDIKQTSESGTIFVCTLPLKLPLIDEIPTEGDTLE